MQYAAYLYACQFYRARRLRPIQPAKTETKPLVRYLSLEGAILPCLLPSRLIGILLRDITFTGSSAFVTLHGKAVWRISRLLPKRSSPADLAGKKTQTVLSGAPGNGASIVGIKIKITAENGWSWYAYMYDSVQTPVDGMLSFYTIILAVSGCGQRNNGRREHDHREQPREKAAINARLLKLKK